MTEVTLDEPVPANMKWRHVFAVAAGNALGFYDFLIFSFFAIPIGQAFFPSHDPSTSLLSSLAVFGVGFFARPIGGIVIGFLGDRAGRKPAMLLSFALMGVSIVGLALTPSYAEIGVAAPALCVFFRLLEGFALGGEVGPTTAYMIEAAPVKRRGFFGALQYASQDFSILCAGLVGFILAQILEPSMLATWGWRIAFLLGSVIVPFALWMRNDLPETWHAPAKVQHEETEAHGIVRIAVLGLFIIGTGAIAAYALIYLATFAQDALGLPPSAAFAATIASGLCGCVIDPTSGILADRFGRKPVMMIPWAVLLVIALPAFFAMVHFKTTLVLLAATIMLSACNQLASPSAIVALAEAMPRRMRSGALATIYAFALAIFGGSTLWILKKLTVVLGTPLAPAFYLCGAAVVGLIAILLFPETAPGRAK
jgi:MFS family permease